MKALGERACDGAHNRRVRRSYHGALIAAPTGYLGPNIGYVLINPRNRAWVCCWTREVSGVIDTDGECAEWTFPAEPDAVRTARHVVRDTLRSWGLDPVVGDVTVLLVSELVTNSLRYASGPIGVRLCLPDHGESAPTLLVEVSDPLPDPPPNAPRHPMTRAAAGCSWWLVPPVAGARAEAGPARPCGSSCP